MPQKRTIPRICQQCGAAFLAKKSVVKRGLGLYCSTRCTGDYLSGHNRKGSGVEVDDDGLTARVPLRAIDGSVKAYAIIDITDVERISPWRWQLVEGYAARTTNRPRKHHIRMHRDLLGLVYGDGLEGDHIDHDTLNNRRSNLRVVNHAGNGQNKSGHRNGTSKYRGVHWHTRDKKWVAQVKVNGRHIYLGRFPSEEAAAEAARNGRALYLPWAVD
jgi:hypothetical protein